MMKTMGRRWVALTIIGSVAAVLLGQVIERLVFYSFNIFSVDQIWIRGIFTSFIGVGSVFIISLSQSIFFLPDLKRSFWWITIMSLSWWIAKYILYVSGFSPFPQPIEMIAGKEIVHGILIAFLVTLSQVLLFGIQKNHRQKWILINSIAILSIFLVQRLLNTLVFVFPLISGGTQYGQFGNAILGAIIDYIFPWYVYGLITARAIMTLRPSS